MSRAEKATERFLKGYNCAQSVFIAFREDLKLDAETALKLSCGFGGGMGRKQEVCGAVTGGIMVLGVIYGRGENDGRSAIEATYGKVRELMNRFEEGKGSYLCRRLTEGCNLGTEEGQKAFKQNDLLHKTCIPCVQSAVSIVEELISADPVEKA